MDALQDAQVVLESGSTQRSAEARIEQDMVDKGDAIKMRHLKKVWKSQMQV